MKKRGLKQAKRTLIELVQEDQADKSYGIIAAYTYNKDNVDQVIQMSPPEIQAMVKVYDNLIPSIACHWGPNAFGYIYVKGK